MIRWRNPTSFQKDTEWSRQKCSPGLEDLAAKNSPKGQGKGGEKGPEKQEQDS